MVVPLWALPCRATGAYSMATVQVRCDVQPANDGRQLLTLPVPLFSRMPAQAARCAGRCTRWAPTSYQPTRQSCSWCRTLGPWCH